jgi:pyruvate/2-oxoglutarate/acetoin dehydrogenase E1 component
MTIARPVDTGEAHRTFDQAVEAALDHAMTNDERVLVRGEDVRLLRRNLLVRHGPDRVLDTPISESVFLGAAVGAALAGLRPVAELYMVDFLAVAFDALLNHAAKFAAFSGGRWTVPLVVRAPCGGGYLRSVAPSTPKRSWPLHRRPGGCWSSTRTTSEAASRARSVRSCSNGTCGCASRG